MRQQIVEIDGHKLAALCALEGRSGTPVVFLHGITVCVDFWPLVLPEAVREGFPWVSLSLPGHYPSQLPPGFQAADVTEELFARLHSRAIAELVGTQPVHLVGWSTGGFSALNLAARCPNQVRSVLSISGFAKGHWKGIIGRMQRLLSLGALGRFAFNTAWTALGRHRWLLDFSLGQAACNRKAFRASPLTKPVLDVWQRALQGHDLGGLQFLFQRLADLDLRNDLPRITAPTLIAGGAEDPFIPVAHTRYLSEHIAGARLHVLLECGHMFFAERTEEYQRLLVDWLAANETRAPPTSVAAASVAC